jgi:hypothetical protein
MGLLLLEWAGRKVRTPQSSVPDNIREGARACMGGTVRRKVPQKTYRLVVVVDLLGAQIRARSLALTWEL